MFCPLYEEELDCEMCYLKDICVNHKQQQCAKCTFRKLLLDQHD